ncbi:phytoene desaturase family protein [Shouchella shacheensis]|uniref:phytoene desaturase family protein n=1 Tax=Shouchella shacheensis TaxID=1649580 RepID=UPI000740105F|nr:phytoene desaturase family protein [Shouchella shacheensis]
MNRKTVIVGSGIGGLVTALYLSHRGDDVIVYERASSFGGRLAYHEREAYKIDQGPTIVLLPEMITSILEEAGMDTSGLTFQRIDPLYRISFPDGSHFWKYQDQQAQEKEIARLFPGEEQAFTAFMKAMQSNFEKGKAAFLDQNFVKRRMFFSYPNLKVLYQLKAYQSVEKMTAHFFSDIRLQNAYKLQSLYIGGNPASSPALYSLVSYSEHEHGIWYLHGGYASLVTAIVQELKSRGVKLVANAEVTSVIGKKRQCRSVVVQGETIRADRFIMNGDFPYVESLVRNKPVKKKYIASSGCLLLYFGLNKVYKESPVHQFILTDDFKGHMDEVFVEQRSPTRPSIYAFHPSIIDNTLAPPGKGVLYALIPVPNTKGQKVSESLIETAIDRLEAEAFPGLRRAITWMDVRTPEDAEQEGLFQGGSFGLAPVLKQSGVFRPQLRPFYYKNVYAVGASTHPGGGIPIVMQGAKLLAAYLRETERGQMK